MARTIGKHNIRLVQNLTKHALKCEVTDVHKYVHENIHISVYDIWESSYDEIDRIINDAIVE